MKLYFGLLRFGIRNGFAYPVVQIIWVGFSYLGVFLMSTIWASAYKSSGGTAQGIPAESVYDYYVLVGIITPFVFSNIARRISIEDIKDGLLSNYLLKPFPYFGIILTREIGWRVVQGTIALPIGMILMITHWKSISVLLTPDAVVPFVLALPAAYFISYLVQFVISMVAFWIKEMNGLIELVNIFRSLFSGIFIPIVFFPEWLKGYIMWTPFYYNLYFPIQILRGQIKGIEILQGYLIWGFWCIVLYSMYTWLWQKGLKIYSAVGR